MRPFRALRLDRSTKLRPCPQPLAAHPGIAIAAEASRQRGARACVRGLLAVLLAASAGSIAEARELAGDEQVLFVPTIARPGAAGRIDVRIEAWVHEREARPGSSAVFARWLDLDLDALPAARRALFLERSQLFRVDSERRKDLRVRFADGSEAALPRTRADGRSSTQVDADAALVGADGSVTFELVMPAGDQRRFAGRAVWVDDEGVSVVSDIDDTIKLSRVTDRRELLLNTFARPFAAAPGMAARYRDLAREPATRFHYVSSSPLQLLPPLARFLDASGFPAGSMHLRETTSLRRLFGKGTDSRTHKLTTIRALLADFPRRRFVLVGDSGEHDPEIYADIARAHPGQVIAIGIRDVTGEPRDAARYRATFAGLDEGLWSVFSSVADWPLVAAPH